MTWNSGVACTYIDRCLSFFTDNINCSNYNIPYTNVAMVGEASISSLSSTKLDSTSAGTTFSAENSTVCNPFGVKAVGNVRTIIPCKYLTCEGHLYVTTRALCFQRIGLFGFEVERVIIPFNIASKIDKCQEINGLFVETKDGKSYQFELVMNQAEQEIDLLCKAWRESPKSLDKTAVHELFRTITTLSPDCETFSDAEECNSDEVNGRENNVEVILNLESVEHDNSEDNAENIKSSWSKFHQRIKEKAYKHQVVMVR